MVSSSLKSFFGELRVIGGEKEERNNKEKGWEQEKERGGKKAKGMREERGLGLKENRPKKEGRAEKE